MKKGLLVALAAVVLLLCYSFAGAEEGKEADLFDLWDYGGESPAWAGFAVPVSEDIVITSPAALPDNTEYLAVSDGKEQWEVRAVLPDRNNLLAVILYESADKPSRYGAWQLLSYGESAVVSSCYVRYGDGMGSRINRAVLSAENYRWMGHNSYLLTLSEQVPLGSPVLTADGELAAIVAARWAEGNNRVLALPPEEIAESLTEVSGLLNNLPDWGDAPDGLTVKTESNRAIIDWNGMTLPEKKESEQLCLVIMDAGNDYLNYYPAETKDRSLTLLMTPGRIYMAGVVASVGMPDSLPEQYVVFSAPQAKKLTEYHFRPVLTAIAEMPEGGGDSGAEPVPVTEVTRELLKSGRAYFYAHAVYEVTEEITDRTLLVTLTTPKGNNYRWESSWIYSPDYMEKDVWYLSLDQTDLLAGLIRDKYAAGVYRMAYYVNGELADMFEFELK